MAGPRSLGLAVALSLAMGAAPGVGGRTAYADELVRMTMDARLRARPAERAPTVVKVEEGEQVKILARKGRWMKVSFKGKVGWVTRTQVEDDVTVTKERTRDEDAKDSKTNRRRGDSGFDTLDEDARGEDGISEEVDGADEDDEDEKVSARDKSKKAKSKKAKAKKPERKASKERPIAVGARVAFVEESPVRLRPNAKADSLFKARRGEIMEVLVAEEDEDFVRVLAKDGSKGWVSRTMVALADSEAGRDARDAARGGGGGRGGGDEDAGAGDDENPVGGSREVASRDDDDEGGDDEGGDDEGGDDERVSVDGESMIEGASDGKIRFGLSARVGLLAKAQAFTSGGATIRANYKLSNSAPAVHLVGAASKSFGPKYVAQVEALYMRTIGGKGITVADATTTEQLGWVTQSVDVRALGGYKLSPNYTVAGVLGYHMAQIVVQESLVAALPGEAVKGIRVGAELQAPKVTSSIGVRASLETIVSGSLTQQDGFRDGDTSAMAGYYASLQAVYAWKPSLVVQAGYMMSYETFAFAGASQREAAATDGTRQDLQHLVLGGVGYQF